MSINYKTDKVYKWMIIKVNPSEQSKIDDLRRIRNLIHEACGIFGMDERLIAAQMFQESSFNSDAKSYHGATGLMQLMPNTAKGIKLPPDNRVCNIDNERDNVLAGVKYLSVQYSKLKSINLALAAYNAGPGNVARYKGMPPFPETKQYVDRIANYYKEICMVQ
jgi:soluble lytic murein transglycosylase-like protein